MDAPSHYLELAHSGRWAEALPVIEALVRQAPDIDTSWFNYGWCLKELKRDGEAVDAFMRCYLIGGQTNVEAYILAAQLVLTADPNDGIPAEPDEPYALVAELLRQKLEESPLERPGDLN